MSQDQVPETSTTGDVAQFSAIAQRCYADAPVSIRLMQTYRPWICPFEELLPWVPKQARVLDVGCGAGLFLILAAAMEKNICGVGFDMNLPAVSAASIAALHPQCKGSDLRFEHRRADQGWPEGEFDVVSLIDVMHHIPLQHRDLMIATAARKLTPRGILLYKDIAVRPYWMSLMNRLHDLVVAREWIRYQPINSVLRAASNEGLAVERHWYPFRWWYSHEAVVLQKGAKTDSNTD